MVHALCVLITKATDTHAEYVILTAFKWQQRLLLLYTSSVGLIVTVNDVLEQNVFGHTSRKCESANRTSHRETLLRIMDQDSKEPSTYETGLIMFVSTR